ncbi:MAG: hypothetical protein BAA01_13890 [Bacillus thermozeamaize]|uniref:DUF1450 domain-containing protein n=1 Tax=Bacillus thermozeamaize TaxID=230954 RepID=A0A1Y3PL20_9BACI|nr:MAG: hypothetical protein BAA01_13890 [Bacillus thermozeamaize]
MQVLTIEICGNNELSWEEGWLDKIRMLGLQKGLEVQIDVNECHDLCSECMMYPYLIVERHVLMADSIPELYQRLVRYLDEKLSQASRREGDEHA